MGVNAMCAAFTSTFWGSLTHRFSPKLLYLRVIVVHLVITLLMGFTTNLHALFALRVIQGLLGGISTIGMIIVSSSSTKEAMASNLGFYQSSITFGQLAGPPLGALLAVTLGYRGAFLSASAILLSSFVFCYFYVTDVALLPREERFSGRKKIDQRVIVGWLLCFVAQVHLMFLPSVLPNVFETFHIERNTALKLAGVIVMLYTATAMIGTYVWSRISKRFGLYKMICILFGLAILLQAMLAFNRGIIDFTVIRMVQTGFVAATVPLVISVFASRESIGSVIGFLNSARFAGIAFGPFVATTVLAMSSLACLYFFISGMTLVVLIGFIIFFKEESTNGRGTIPSFLRS